MSYLIEDKVTIESFMLSLEDLNPQAMLPLVVHQNHPLLEAVRRLEENMNTLTMMRRREREEIRALLGGARLEAEELRLALERDVYKNKGSFRRFFDLGCYYFILYVLATKVAYLIKKSIQAIDHEDSKRVAAPVIVGAVAAVIVYGVFKTIKEPVINNTSVMDEHPRMPS